MEDRSPLVDKVIEVVVVPGERSRQTTTAS